MYKRTSSPLAQLLIIMLSVAACATLISLLGMALAPAFGFTFEEVRNGSTTNPALVRYLMAVQTTGLFLLPPLVAARFITGKPLSYMGLVRNPLPMNLLNVLMLMVIIQPFIGFASSVNASLPLPEWSTALDRQAEELTGLMLQTTGVGDFSANLLVAAALPAIGEELLFRGFLQNLLRRVLKNPHVAIFTTAFIFSAIHLQFQGFIPRLLLGALLGYLYYWSGSLWLSCAAHFANNALAVCAYYYVAVKQIPVTPESIDATLQSGGWLAALSVMVSALMLMRIYQMERISRMKQRRTP